MLLRGVGLGRAVRSTVILGAGASRGASFANSSRQVLPPLDADFFQQAQRLDEPVFKELARDVIKFVREEYGATQLPTLETLFTQLQGYEQFLQQFYAKRGRRPGRYKRELQHLLELIPLLFRSAFEDQACEWHDRIAHALRAGDAVISFNYDVLMDEALSRLGDGIWKADRGYDSKLKTETRIGRRNRLGTSRTRPTYVYSSRTAHFTGPSSTARLSIFDWRPMATGSVQHEETSFRPPGTRPSSESGPGSRSGKRRATCFSRRVA